MSTNILKKLVEQFAPETVKAQIADIEKVAKTERAARQERQWREQALLESLKHNGNGRVHEPIMALPALP
jgi:hypothetical protein